MRQPSLASRPVRLAVRRHPTALAVAVFGVLAVVCAAAAYWSIFTVFQPYDDEGTLLVTVRAFAHGDTLYRDIYSQYGPFYYEIFGGLFALTGKEVTTDASRSIVVVVWVIASLMLGAATMRMTRSLALGVAGMAVAFTQLYALQNEPMHPVGLCLLLLAALVLAFVTLADRGPVLLGVVTGALVAALCLTKINLGGFAVAGVAVAAVLTVGPLHRRGWIRWPVVAVFVVLPLVLTQSRLRLDYIRDFVVWSSLSFAAVAVAASSLRPPPREDPAEDAVLVRWALAAVAGFVGLSVLSVGFLLASGASLGDAYDGIVGQALHQADAFSIGFGLPLSATQWAFLGLAGAAVTVRLGPGSGAMAGGLRVAAGLVIWATAARFGPAWANPSGPPNVIPMALAWVAAVPPAGTVLGPWQRLIRVLLPALAVAEVLQVYPVAGTQVVASTVMFGPVGAICIADGWRLLEQRLPATRGISPETVRYVGSVAAITLAVSLVWTQVVRNGINSAVAYADRKPLPFPEASRMRLSDGEVSTFTQLVAAIRNTRCTSLIMYPSYNSLYLWSGVPTPKPTLPGAWFEQMDDKTQQRAVDEVRASPRPCAIRNDQGAAAWLGPRPMPDTPGTRYITRDFKVAGTVGGFQFLVPKKG